MKRLAVLMFGLSVLSLCAAESLRLTLPEKIYAMPGVECNLYFDSVANVINPANYFFEVRAPKGRNDIKRWRFIPAEKDCGEFELQLNVYDDAGLAGSGKRKSSSCRKPEKRRGRFF